MRKNLNLTQNEISKSSNIDSVTIRRIEKGKVLPRLDTLELLSTIYKEDLVQLLLEYRVDDYSVFCEINNRVELKLDCGEFHALDIEIGKLKLLLSSTKNIYYKNLITQIILLTESIILYKYNNNNNKALDKLIKSLKITTPTFNLDDYDSFVYSSMEIRILMNIAFVLDKLNHKQSYLKIMEHCISSIDYNDKMYNKVCHNLAGAYTRNMDYNKALKYYNIGIKHSQKNRNLTGLSLLYYGKGFAEYKLNKEEYIKSIRISIYLCEALGQELLKNTIINNCKEFLGVDL